MTPTPRRLLVGLTGGLASGKSTVARALADKGCTVLDADRVVADLYRPGGAGAEALRRLFGAEVLAADGAVDRQQVAARIFRDPAARQQLEAVIHPLVRQRTNELLQAATGIVVYEATLLVEAGRADDFDLVVSVEADEDLRLARAMARGLSEADARARLEAQGDGRQRRQRTERILPNNGSQEELRRAIDDLYQDLQARLARGPESEP